MRVKKKHQLSFLYWQTTWYTHADSSQQLSQARVFQAGAYDSNANADFRGKKEIVHDEATRNL